MKALLDRVGLLVRARYPLLYLLTHEEARVERNLRRLCESEALALWRWSSTQGMRDEEGTELTGTQDPMAALQAVQDKLKGPGLVLLVDFHHALNRPDVVRRLRDLESVLGKRGQALAVLSPILNVPDELEKDVVLLDVPLPNREEVGRLLGVLLRRKKVEIDPELYERFVKASLGLTEKEIQRAYARILLSGGTFDEERLQDLVLTKRQAIRRSQHLEMYEDVGDLSSVGGLKNLKEWLDARGKAFSEQARAFGLPEPKGVFLLGVQGCGKSLTAKAVAGHFQMPLLRMDVSALFASSDSEGSMRETIRIAESIAPAVLWIDELEKGFARGGGDGSSFGTFLTWLQEKTKPVFVVATANEVRALPPELLRKGRFDEIFFVDLPTAHERLSILDIHIRQRGRDPEDFDLFSAAEESEKYSGAELEQVVVEGMFNAYAEGRELNTRDLQRVLRDTVPLAVTMDDRLKELREWARPRTRPASLDRRRIDYFADFQEG